ncbi:hypothetical protein BSLG_005759 [Batrachochytrium salamandrivorans]|nr:hypothetical protein BSLG_005759 [Batrachochytrium salamandrivorans]
MNVLMYDIRVGKVIEVTAHPERDVFYLKAWFLLLQMRDKSVVELEPNEDSKIGEQVTFDGFTFSPDQTLNPKHKVFEKCAVDFLTTEECVATYKNIPFKTESRPSDRAFSSQGR